MKVICISAKAQHGKDTVANFMKECLEAKRKRVLVTHYADLLKYICKTFFNWDGQKDEKGRTLLQQVGTESIRAEDPNYWVGFIADMLYFFEDQWDYVLIPDTRFPNEIDYLKDAGFDVLYIRIIRENFESPLTEEQQKHPSETALDGYEADVLLYNDSTLENLKFSVERLTDVLVQLPLQVREEKKESCQD